MDLIIAVSLLFSAYFIGFETHVESDGYYITDILLYVIFLVDFILNFFTSYVDEENNNVLNILA
jgi:hypothetical protein